MAVRAVVVVLLMACTSVPGDLADDPAATPAVTPAPSATPEPGGELSGRRADLEALVEAYEWTHPSPPARLRDRVQALAARADDLSSDEFLVEVSRLTAGRDRDGHTGVFPLGQPDLGIWPLQLYEFDDGWRVIRARPPYRELVGGKVTAIGGRPVAQVKRMTTPLVSRDNAATVRGRLPQYVIVPAVLRGLGLEASLTVDGRRVVPQPISTEAYATWADIFYPLVCPRLRAPDVPDWAVRRSGDAVVARFGLVSSLSDDLGIDEFADRVRRLARKTSGPVVIDVRDNPGGDNGTYRALLSAVVEIARRDPRRLRLVFGRCTFSAATNFAAEVMAETDAVSFGEPMGGSPNMWGDADEFTLPESGIVLHVATVKWELGGRDWRPMIKPDVAVPLRWSDYRGGKDQALRAARR